jgi:L-aminopeptidase/D-esterase-like protein
VNGSLTDVAGIEVGHVTRHGDGWLTGVTAVLAPPGTIGGVDVRGGGPGTHETDALDPRTLVPTVDAVVLAGGSAYGLVTAHGVQRWLAERGRGFPVGPGPGEVVPIVPAAAVFDLGRGGVFGNHPTEQMGYEAAGAAHPGPVERGVVGAGTGAVVGGRWKGGVGSASAVSGNVVVAALAVVNAVGVPVAGPLEPGPLEPRPLEPGPLEPGPLNTTLVVVATNARLDPAETSRTATVAHDGLARALNPVHTLADGDTVFALATGAVALADDRATRVRELVELQRVTADVVRDAVLDGIASAETTGPFPRYPR